MQSYSIINNLSEVVDNYSAFIVDLWGVIHDGRQTYAHAQEVIEKLHVAGKDIIFLSNAPRRSHKVREKLANFGIKDSQYKGIITSGEVLYNRLATNPEKYGIKEGSKYFYIGPKRDDHLFDGTNYSETQELSEASFVLVTGFEDDIDDLSKQVPVLEQAKKHGLKLLCANPDLYVVRITGEKFLCAGATAKEYEKMGGEVVYFGKPHRECYESCFDRFASKDRILAVGDSFHTDLKGANTVGIDCLLIAGGIHNSEILSNNEIQTSNLNKLCDKFDVSPKYVQSYFRW